MLYGDVVCRLYQCADTTDTSHSVSNAQPCSTLHCIKSE